MQQNLKGKKEIFLDTDKFIPNHSVDCVIIGFDNHELKILLIKLNFDNYWALPGGFIFKDEDIDIASQRVLNDRTGLQNVFLNQFYTFGKNNRNILPESLEKEKWEEENRDFVNEGFNKWINKRFITTGYFALVDIGKAKLHSNIYKEKSEWISVKKIPELIYDHKEIVSKALEQVKIQLNYLPISINLLPDKFTMQDLQKLYEAILNKKLERSNFQRKMLKLNIFIRLEKQFSGAANKAPYLYKFDKKKYIELIKMGVGFHF